MQAASARLNGRCQAFVVRQNRVCRGQNATHQSYQSISKSGPAMEFLEQLWEVIGNFFTGLSRAVERGITSLFGSSNARYIKKLQPKIDAINALEPKFQAMSDGDLKQQTTLFRERLDQGES